MKDVSKKLTAEESAQALAELRKSTAAAKRAKKTYQDKLAERDRQIAEFMAADVPPREIQAVTGVNRARLYQIFEAYHKGK